VEEREDVGAGEVLAALTLLDQEHELFESELAACGVDAGDRAWVAGIDVAEVILTVSEVMQ